jgi:hypothetical protein
MSTEPTKTTNAPAANGMTPERWAQILERIHERNKDPEYKQRLEERFAEAQKVREQINEQERRWLDEEGK